MTVVVFVVASIMIPAMIVVAILFVVTMAVDLRDCQSFNEKKAGDVGHTCLRVPTAIILPP